MRTKSASTLEDNLSFCFTAEITVSSPPPPPGLLEDERLASAHQAEAFTRQIQNLQGIKTIKHGAQLAHNPRKDKSIVRSIYLINIQPLFFFIDPLWFTTERSLNIDWTKQKQKFFRVVIVMNSSCSYCES